MTPRSFIMSTVRFDASADAADRIGRETAGMASVDSISTALSGREVRVIVRGEGADGELRVVSVCVGKISTERTLRSV